jgi:ligand-binding sensor domain-containing protein
LKKIVFITLLLLQKIIVAQYPQYFEYNDENGSPSNEIYSIVQDYKGFVWFGCDAGLFKYDGNRYIPYRSKSQQAKSITGLTLSSSGKLYCYNFQSQVFMLQNDTLIEIANLFPVIITGISSQVNGLIFISHSSGLNIYNENKNSWSRYGTFKNNHTLISNQHVCKISKHQPKDTVLLLKPNAIAEYYNGKIKEFNTDLFKSQSPGLFKLEYHNQLLWIFSTEDNKIYTYSKDKIEQKKSSKLSSVLANLKITNVKSLPDGNLWICTYKGIIKYDATKDLAELYYPEKSFSDCMIDREGNYWFSTLQTGLFRISNVNMLVWNRDNELLRSDKISKLAFGNDYIYFAVINGTIGKLHYKTHKLQLYQTGSLGDIQSFNYDDKTKTLWSYLDNNLFSLKENTIKKQATKIKAIKTIKYIGNDCFIGSSSGLYINDKNIFPRWIREIDYDEKNHTVWVASNDGLIKIIHKNNEWKLENKFLEANQILSLDWDEESQNIYAVLFNGKLYSVNIEGKISYLSEIPDITLVQKILYSKGTIYTATNKGLWKYDIKNNRWATLNKFNGLASNNITSLAITNESIWLSTGRGVQKIPIRENLNYIASRVYLRKMVVGKTTISNSSVIILNYGASLILYPEAGAYNSNGNYQYTYRIKSTDTNWISMPSSIERIEIQNIPSGEFEIELKGIDHLGYDSENTIVLKGTMKPPFWESFWFRILGILLITILIFILFRIRENKMQETQRKELDRIGIENELRLSRETALKSQMNPHFIFNVLNSIKAYIYKNDKLKATTYLNEFSDLIRTFLTMSNRESITLENELKMLHQYINMEKMLLNDELEYELKIDDEIDITQTHIPSLIIQPFIENAFKHGLLNKTGTKALTINIRHENSHSICIEIIDNGIGRAAAEKMRNSNLYHHDSFASNAIEKRIELINKNQVKIQMNTIDLYDESKTALGTKVILKIKVNE